ncbi:response regulator [Luteolibacter flavescens]|uniref:histidine kinase n=1 Tax=Luteolibacter flavescens TaxID=1859460 RepID=A0ABT3FHU3_9BACT|nr:response regulator [Luteolibacter flavescens]MCW1883142.1 response regulator [Luteolibacter flavescens]
MPIHHRHLAVPAKKATTLPLYLGFAAAVIFFLCSGYITFRNIVVLREASREIEETHSEIASLERVLALMKDAETGQRGFVITGNESYLQPYRSARTALAAEMTRMREATSGSTDQKALFLQIESQISAKLAELDETVSLRRDSGFEAARQVVDTDRGKQIMDDIRENLGALADEERHIREARLEEREAAQSVALASGLVTAGLGIALSAIITWLIRRAHAVRRRQEWSQAGKLEMSAVMSGEKGMIPLAESILTYLSRHLDAHAGAVFAMRSGSFDRVAAIGVPAGSGLPDRFEAGEGLLGRAVAEKSLQRIDDVPEDYLAVGSGLGKGTPRHLVILPALVDESVNCVIELGFIHPLDRAAEAFLLDVSEQIGVAIKSAAYREHLQELLEETQRQSEEMQAQSEELRVSNEELEEQGRALQESQARLEMQQVELEQTNEELLDQANALEDQKRQLLLGKESLEQQARVIEQASRYKSDFLANMSHELRTPLNSALILAKLLSENRPGNLTDEQIKFAVTIQTAGNDLLNLINDVLDLSKIEAGHMEVHSETVSIPRMLTGLGDVFQPVATGKSLRLELSAAPGAPEQIVTDSKRLEQVLKNLLSNALKFTESGSVRLEVTAVGEQVAISVTDTGIGISPEHQGLIFEPFSQADGSTARKYGGTGLGLSISRNLVRLLGGEITLASEPGKGSVFTVHLPLSLRQAELRQEFIPTPGVAVQAAPVTLPPAAASVVMARIPDDREQLDAERRIILVVEDDEAFANILHDLAHELSFQCLVATSAEEGLLLAREHLPSAVLLDVGLPDHSGLFVLERLKADPRTRHIPVHIVSANDYSRTALSLGAVGYLLKPVKHEELVNALRGLETRLTRKMRRVLVVEDDLVQMEALGHLLESSEVTTVGVGTVAECLEKLSTETFDCMVLDLSLPDASGFSLLEKLSEGDSYSFPPVIVYTGRDLSTEEEQDLRRYSQSIIVKGAKSPERLLDEVSLFLHQVVSELPPEKQRMLKMAGNRDAVLEGRCILIAEDDVRNIFALTSVLEGRGMKLRIARNGKEAITALEEAQGDPEKQIDLVLMDVMMPEMDGLTATREIRKRHEWARLPIITLTAKAMKSDQEQCLAAGANDYLAKPLDVEKLLSLIRVWMPR